MIKSYSKGELQELYNKYGHTMSTELYDYNTFRLTKCSSKERLRYYNYDKYLESQSDRATYLDTWFGWTPSFDSPYSLPPTLEDFLERFDDDYRSAYDPWGYTNGW